MTALIVCRTLQGLGGGALIPLGMTIIADLYGLEQRARMQGYFSATWGLASIVGPLIGGFLTDHLSWRWVFFVNTPVRAPGRPRSSAWRWWGSTGRVDRSRSTSGGPRCSRPAWPDS